MRHSSIKKKRKLQVSRRQNNSRSRKDIANGSKPVLRRRRRRREATTLEESVFFIEIRKNKRIGPSANLATPPPPTISFWNHTSCVHKRDPSLWSPSWRFWDNHLGPFLAERTLCSSRRLLPQDFHKQRSVLRSYHNCIHRKCVPMYADWQRSRKLRIFHRLQ